MTAESCKTHEQIGDQFSKDDDRDGAFYIPDFDPRVFPEIYEEGLIPNLDVIGLNPGVTELHTAQPSQITIRILYTS
ncbi:mitogen activated protein kinase [Apiospora arundinis]